MALRSILTGALALGVVACGFVLGIDDLPIPSGGGADASPALAAMEEDAGAGVDLDAAVVIVTPDAAEAGPEAGPAEAIAVLGGKFSIDAVEVTKDAYDRFLAAVATGAVDAGGLTHPSCGWKTSHVPATACAFPADGRAPITCVDWCDAWAYCAWSGKRLCGAISGGAVAPGERSNPSKSQWQQACRGFGPPFPYGATSIAGACATRDALDGGRPQPVRSFPTCEGAPRGLFDMVGNVDEWDDSCAASADGGPASDECVSWGGSYLESAKIASCEFVAVHARSSRLPSLGFRCCQD